MKSLVARCILISVTAAVIAGMGFAEKPPLEVFLNVYAFVWAVVAAVWWAFITLVDDY
jgi:hypothetical protein